LARVLLADSLLGANWPGSEKAANRFGAWIKCWDAIVVIVGIIRVVLKNADNDN